MEDYRRRYYQSVANPSAAVVLKALEAWAAAQPDLRVARGTGPKEQRLHIVHKRSDVVVLRLKPSGGVEIDFEYLIHSPAFRGQAQRVALRDRLRTIGLELSDAQISKYPVIDYKQLASAERFARFTGIIDWVIGRLNSINY